MDGLKTWNDFARLKNTVSQSCKIVTSSVASGASMIFIFSMSHMEGGMDMFLATLLRTSGAKNTPINLSTQVWWRCGGGWRLLAQRGAGNGAPGSGAHNGQCSAVVRATAVRANGSALHSSSAFTAALIVGSGGLGGGQQRTRQRFWQRTSVGIMVATPSGSNSHFSWRWSHNSNTRIFWR
jgi:hypothetical protein